RRSGFEKSDLYRSRPRKHAFDVHKGDCKGKALAVPAIPAGPGRAVQRYGGNAKFARPVMGEWCGSRLGGFPQHRTALAGQLASVSFRAADLLGWDERFGEQRGNARSVQLVLPGDMAR